MAAHTDLATEISRRRTFTLRMFYAGILFESSHWVACRFCGALWDEADGLDSHHAGNHCIALADR